MTEEFSPQEALNMMAQDIRAIRKDLVTINNRLGIIVLPFWLWLIVMVLGTLIGIVYILILLAGG